MKWCILIFVLSLTSCLSETEFKPNVPAPTGYTAPPPPTIDFYFRISRTQEGLVHFENKSVWMENFLWDFDFMDENGNPAQSRLEDPDFEFPSNGFYTITLSAIDTSGTAHSYQRVLDLDNYPGN